jgi:tRNA-modifying protein YgfZ
MAVPSPLESTFRDAGGVLMTYGPSEPSDTTQRAPAMVAAFGPLELEYAALRKHAALLDLPILCVIEVKGPDRLDFLNRMLTQELKGLQALEARPSFWLNRKGRVDADMLVVHEDDRTLLLVDVLALRRTMQGIGAYLITEDCTLHDASQELHSIALHGPTVGQLLDLLCAPVKPSTLEPFRAVRAMISGVSVLILRHDTAGVPGYLLIMPTGSTPAVTQALVGAGHDPARHEEPGRAIALRQLDRPSSTIRLQLIGWHAYNMARLEAGTPLYNLDFGPESLPNETGVLNSRVSFTKGCYLGQEVVARMHARKAMKQTLVAIKFYPITTTPEDPYQPVPDPGAAVGFGYDPEKLIGTITSAAPSPAHAMAPIAFAQIRTQHADPSLVVATTAGERIIKGVIHPTLRTVDVSTPASP